MARCRCCPFPSPSPPCSSGFAVSQVANLATTVYLHRAAAHRAVRLRPPLTFAFRFITWITVGLKPREWVAVHRKHHAYTDVEGDPHSPKLLGWVRVQFTNAALYRREARNPETVRRYAKDMPPDWWDRHVFDHAFVGLGPRHRRADRAARPGLGPRRRRSPTRSSTSASAAP